MKRTIKSIILLLLFTTQMQAQEIINPVYPENYPKEEIDELNKWVILEWKKKACSKNKNKVKRIRIVHVFSYELDSLKKEKFLNKTFYKKMKKGYCLRSIYSKILFFKVKKQKELLCTDSYFYDENNKPLGDTYYCFGGDWFYYDELFTDPKYQNIHYFRLSGVSSLNILFGLTPQNDILVFKSMDRGIEDKFIEISMEDFVNKYWDDYVFDVHFQNIK